MSYTFLSRLQHEADVLTRKSWRLAADSTGVDYITTPGIIKRIEKVAHYVCRNRLTKDTHVSVPDDVTDSLQFVYHDKNYGCIAMIVMDVNQPDNGNPLVKLYLGDEAYFGPASEYENNVDFEDTLEDEDFEANRIPDKGDKVIIKEVGKNKLSTLILVGYDNDPDPEFESALFYNPNSTKSVVKKFEDISVVSGAREFRYKYEYKRDDDSIIPMILEGSLRADSVGTAIVMLACKHTEDQRRLFRVMADSRYETTKLFEVFTDNLTLTRVTIEETYLVKKLAELRESNVISSREVKRCVNFR